jgi:hypothetical protein
MPAEVNFFAAACLQRHIQCARARGQEDVFPTLAATVAQYLLKSASARPLAMLAALLGTCDRSSPAC